MREAKLEGREVSFSGSLGGSPFSFRGRVEGNRIAGQAELGTRTLPLEFVK